MDRSDLPKVYRGFLTADLLEQLDKISAGVKEELHLSPAMMIAIGALVRNYELTLEARIGAMIKRELAKDSKTGA